MKFIFSILIVSHFASPSFAIDCLQKDRMLVSTMERTKTKCVLIPIRHLSLMTEYFHNGQSHSAMTRDGREMYWSGGYRIERETVKKYLVQITNVCARQIVSSENQEDVSTADSLYFTVVKQGGTFGISGYSGQGWALFETRAGYQEALARSQEEAEAMLPALEQKCNDTLNSYQMCRPISN